MYFLSLFFHVYRVLDGSRTVLLTHRTFRKQGRPGRALRPVTTTSERGPRTSAVSDLGTEVSVTPLTVGGPEVLQVTRYP